MAQTVRLRRSSVSGQKPTNTNLQLGEIALNTADGKAFMAVSGSLGPSVEEFILTNTVNTGSLYLIGDVTASSFSGDASRLSNVPFEITGSDVDGNNFDKQFTKLHFDSETGLNVSESAPGTAFISIGSHFRDIFVSGSGMLRATGSDAFEIISEGGIEVTVQNTDTNTNGYTKELVFSTTELSSSLNSRIDVITGSLNDLSSSVNDHLTSLDNFTSSVVLTSETSSMTVLSASYAVTAAFALNAGAGGGGAALGSYTLLDQSTAATTWSFQHNTGQRYPIFQIFDENGDVIIPTQIRTIDENNAEIVFGSAQSGTAIASLGGGNGVTEEFTNSSLWVVDHYLGTDYPDVTIWDSNRNIIFPDRIESVDTNQIKVYFSVPVSGHVSVSRGGHIISGSFDWTTLSNIPSGIVSGSDQLTGSYDDRYVLSGSITQTTWDNIANKPEGIVSGSEQIELTGTTGYSTFSSSIDTSISASISTLNDYNDTQDGRIDSLESESGSIRFDFNSFTSSVYPKLDGLENVSSSLLVMSSSLEDAIEFTGSNVTIKGDLLVKGTETKVDSTTVQIGDNIIELNGTGATNAGLVVRDATNPNTISGSLLWDTTNDYWIAGPVGTEERIILEGEYNTFTSSTDNRLNSIETESGSIRGDFNSYTSSNNDRIDSLETESGSIRSDFNSFTSSYNTGSFTGSFIGDGTLLYNIPASGVTGLQLDKIADGSVTASISEVDGFIVNTDTTITGSVNITGSIILNGDPVGTGKLDSTEFYTYTSSVDLQIQSLETESGSIRGDFNSYTSSNDSRIDSLESKTGSYATTGSNEFIGDQNINGNLSVTGSVVISGSLDISNANVGSSRYLHTQSTTSDTWTIVHNLGYNYPNVTIYDGSNNKVMLPSDITSIDVNTTQVTFAVPEYGYALVSVGGVTTATADRYLHTVSVATGSWVIDHNLGFQYPNIDVYDENDEQLIPQKVTAVSINRTQIDFATPTSGNAIITMGGPRSTSIFNQTGSYYNTQYNIGITGSLVVTGDVDASSFNTTSDKMLKTNLERIEGSLDKIEKLNGYTFDWIEGYGDDKSKQIGMVANEVYEVQPELISKRTIMLGGKEEEIMLLDYSKVTALLIEGIKELKDRVSKLENKRKRK